MKILLIVTGDTGLQYHRQIVPHKVLHRLTGTEVRIVHNFDAVSDIELQYFDIVQFIRQISITGRTKEIIDRCHANGCKVVFDIDDNPSYSTIRYFKEKYTIISEVNSIKFGV